MRGGFFDLPVGRLIASQKAVYLAATAFSQKVTQKGPENMSILSFRAAARNLYNKIPCRYRHRGMVLTKISGII